MKLSARAAFFVLAIVLCAPAFAAETTPFERRVNDLIGIWFAAPPGKGAGRVFRVTNVKSADPASASIVAYYGYAHGAWHEASDVAVRPEGDRVRVEFTSRSDSRVVLHLDADNTLRGAVDTASGKRISLGFAHTSLPEVHRWAAEHPLPKVRANKSSTIDLVYLSAADCPSCRGWEAENIASGKLKGSPEWASIRFTEVSRISFKGRLAASDVPEHFRPAFERLEKARSSALYGTPSFVVLVNGEIRCASFGSGNYESLVFPTVQAAVREKLADAKN